MNGIIKQIERDPEFSKVLFLPDLCQYKCESMMSILRNLKVIVIVLENFIANEPEKYNKNECLGILKSLTNIN